MQVAHSYQIDSYEELKAGWYFQVAEGEPLFGPYETEAEAEAEAEAKAFSGVE